MVCWLGLRAYQTVNKELNSIFLICKKYFKVFTRQIRMAGLLKHHHWFLTIHTTGTPPLTRFFGTQKNRVKGKPRYRRSVLLVKQENGTLLLPKSTFWDNILLPKSTFWEKNLLPKSTFWEKCLELDSKNAL